MIFTTIKVLLSIRWLFEMWYYRKAFIDTSTARPL
jgi:hypothetical protein